MSAHAPSRLAGSRRYYMLNKTIGVFDSGLGGLTAVEELSRLLPQADIVYFGDTGHLPYGGRSPEQLMFMARKNIAFLEGRGAGLILAACGTVTSVALDTVSAETETPLFGVARPAARTAAALTRNGVIGFLATEACVKSGYNQRVIAEYAPGAKVVAVACPKFVPLIESGVGSGAELDAAIDEYLAPIVAAGADTVILGCTHYPIISAEIDRRLGGSARLVSSSGEAARALAASLDGKIGGSGMRKYFVSGDAALFASTAEKLLGRAPDGEIVSVEPYDIEVAP